MKNFYVWLLCLIASIGAANAQSVTASGTVVDETGRPMAGVAVVVKGVSARGVNTDAGGQFSLSVPSAQSVLEFSFVGYTGRELTAATGMRVVMQPSQIDIDEVVVTGMTQIDKRMFTGATDRLSGELVKLDGMADISRALEGRSAGVMVTNVSGTFGAAPKIRVRGATSILGASKPLWVVDGVIIEDVGDVSADDLSTGDANTLISSAVAGLSADDIEDFQILKDGSATSIYGARAMAGVIVVTTKKGKAGETRVSYTGEFTSRLKPTYREFDVMNSQDQMAFYKEMEEKGWMKMESVMRYKNSGVYGQMYRLINTYDEQTGMFGLDATDAAMAAYLQQAEMRNTDWFDELFSNSIMQQHSVSISSGTSRATNYISLSAMDDPGWYKRSDVRRYTARANSSVRVMDKLKLDIMTSASYRNQKAPGTMTQDISDLYGEVSRNFDINPFSYAMNTSRTIAADGYHVRNYTTFNVHEELENNYMDVNVLDANFQGQLTWNPISNLTLKALGAVKYSSNTYQWHLRETANAARAYRLSGDASIDDVNDYLYTDPEDPYGQPVSVLPLGGIFDKTELRLLTTDFRFDATYSRQFDENNNLHVFAGMEVNQTERSRDWFQGWGLLYELGEMAQFDYLAFKKMSEGNNDYFSLRNSNKRNVAFFSTATWLFRSRYTLNGTLRYEGTNRLGRVRSARWLPTWNVAGGWQVDQEPFFEKVEGIFTHMKLRASYSLTADSPPAYVTNSTDLIYSTSYWRPNLSLQEAQLYISQSENDRLTYEKKHELNLGLDFGVLDDRITVQTDVYWRNNFDLIGRVMTQGLTGEIRRYANIADMKTRGVELTVSSVNIKRPDFRWTTDLTFSKTYGRITRLVGDSQLYNLLRGTQYSMEGYPVWALFSIPFLGLDGDGMPIFKGAYEPTISQSNYSTASVFQITDEDVMRDYLKYEGPGEPTITGGLNNTFRYKNWNLSVFMTYGFGNKIRLRSIFSYRYSDMTASSEVFKNRWTQAGEENRTNVPTILDARQVQKLSTAYARRAYSMYNNSDVRVAKGDFVRMKEIALGYTFPEPMLEKMRMQRMSVKFSAVNPFLVYADKALNGQDPEFIESGGVSSPIAKQFTFTVRIGF
jgi:TonB-linked SusC/RagA family outer membrane protein